MKKLLIPLVIIVAVVVGAVIIMNSSSKTEVSDTQASPPPSAQVTENNNTPPPVLPPPPPAPPVAPPPASQGTFSGEDDIGGSPDVMVHQITYDGSKYSPSTLTIKKGDVVKFQNSSSGSFWPASGPHPVHTNYPEFDPKKAIAAGQSWSFTFSKTGAWKFHDHLNPSANGTITVTN